MDPKIKQKLHDRCEEILKECLPRGGFLTQEETDVLALSTLYASTTLLVRCGAERFLTTPTNLRKRIYEVQESGDYVRDVCIPADDYKKLAQRFSR